MKTKSLVLLLAAAVVAMMAAGCGDSGDTAPSGDTSAPQDQASQTPAETAPDDEAEETRPKVTVIRIAVKNGKVNTAEEVVTVSVGDKVRLQVTSDTADEVHVHGYERKADVAPGEPAIIKFNADLKGRFEVELEDAGLELIHLRVR